MQDSTSTIIIKIYILYCVSVNNVVPVLYEITSGYVYKQWTFLHDAKLMYLKFLPYFL